MGYNKLNQQPAKEIPIGKAADIRGQMIKGVKVLYRAQPPRPNDRNAWFWCKKIQCGHEFIYKAAKLKQPSEILCPICELKKRDISNQVFGQLTALYPTEKRDYENNVIWHCRCSCGTEIDVSKKTLTTGHNCMCPKCRSELTRKINFVDLTGKKFNKLTVLAITDMRDSGAVVWKCQCDCGRITYVNTNGLTSNSIKSCGICGHQIHSAGAQKIIEILQSNNIQYEQEKRFPTCKNIHSLPFDFWVNNQYLIEYDGEQHFHPVQFGGCSQDQAENNLSQIKINDTIKNNWCIKNNIQLIRIPYTHYNNLCLEDLKPETTTFLINK